MISHILEQKILFFYLHEKWPVGTIAKHLQIHHSTVKRILVHSGKTEESFNCGRKSILEPFIPYMRECLEKYPDIRASRLWQMCLERGYKGKQDHFRSFVARLRPRKKHEAFLRLTTLPGEEAQVDWGHFGHFQIGKAKRPLSAFVMVLSWSRQIYLEFFLEQRMRAFLSGHNNAFEFFSGIPRVLLYDNLKTAVTERIGEAIKFNETFLTYASKVGFEPRPVNVRRGNEKGRVERSIRFIRDNFFAARKFSSLEDLNVQAREWMTGVAAQRKCPGETDMTVEQAFQQEKNIIRKIANPLPWVEEKVIAKVGKTHYVRFEGNDYSVEPECVRETVTLLISGELVRVLYGDKIVGTHKRCYDKGKIIEDEKHILALRELKKMARHTSAIGLIQNAVPEIKEFLIELGKVGGNIGSAVSALDKLLSKYGENELKLAVKEAIDAKTFHTGSVAFILNRRIAEKNTPLMVEIQLLDNPKIKNISVNSHDLKNYDSLGDNNKITESDSEGDESDENLCKIF